MHKYFIRYKANTMFSLGHREDHAKGIAQSGNFVLSQQEITVYEILKPIKNGYAFVGLGFDGYIEANNPEEAISRMFNIVNFILCLYSYITLSPYNKVVLIDMYEADGAIKQRKFSHYYYPAFQDEVQKAIRAVNMEVFMGAWHDGAHGIFTSNVLNSLHQLNKSLQEDMVMDEFLDLWNGIEYLAKVINKKCSIAETRKYIKCRKCKLDIMKCGNCGHEFQEEVKTQGKFDGIRLLAEKKMKLSRKDFDALHAVRSILLHDGGFKQEWLQLIATVRELLIYTIAEAIEMQDSYVKETLKLQPKKDNMTSRDNKLVHSAVISGLDKLPSIDSIASQPTLIYKGSEAPPEYSMEKNGVITVKRHLNFEYRAPEGVTFNEIVGEIWMPKEAGILNANLETKNES